MRGSRCLWLHREFEANLSQKDLVSKRKEKKGKEKKTEKQNISKKWLSEFIATDRAKLCQLKEIKQITIQVACQ